MEYAVVARMHNGSQIILQAGFATREDAEDHPIRLSQWKQVWVEPIEITGEAG